MAKKQKLSVPVLRYTLYFSVFAFFCLIIFVLINGSSLFDNADGLWQQYTYFISSGRILRNFFIRLFHDHVFEYPMWDMTIGMGSDMHIVFNPFSSPLICIISAFVPLRYSEYVFDLIIIFRLYLSGVAFIAFANEKGYRDMNAVAGAMVYVFSATTFVIFKQMGFSIVFIMFPLILLGADRIWNKKKALLYFIAVAYSTVASFYFTYMMIILLLIYCIIRFFCEPERKISRFFALLGRFSFFTVLSVFTGIGPVLPSLINLSKLSRLSQKFEIRILDLEIVRKFFSYCFTCISPGGDALFGVSSFVVVAAVCLFVSKKKSGTLKWCSALCLLSLAFPYVGSVLNGFNMVSYRYIFALILCLAFTVTVSFDQIQLFKGKVWYLSIGAAVIYTVICMIFIDAYAAVSGFSLLLSVLLAGIINLLKNLRKEMRETLYVTVILVSCILIGYTSINICIGHLLPRGSLYEDLYVNGGMSTRISVNDKNYRTDTINPDFAGNIMNSSMAAAINGFDFYHSNQNQHIADYYSSLAVLGNPMGFSHTGFRGRCYAEIMNTCRYIVRYDGDRKCIRAPYSYEYVSTSGNYSLYKAGRGVSLAYFYDDVMPYDSYMKLDPLMRETNLMHYLVLDETGNTNTKAVTDLEEISYGHDVDHNITIDGKNVTVEGESGYISIKPSGIKKGQVSVLVTGLRSSDVSSIYRNAVALINAEGKAISADYSAHHPSNSGYYTGDDDIVFSFENIDEEVDSIRLYFFTPGKYNLDGIRVYSRPAEKMEQTLVDFYSHADMDNVSYDYSGNRLNISVNSSSDRYLYVAMPFSEGWTAKVDGTPVKILRANVAFMAIPVNSGSHTIEMTYQTPYLLTGLMITAAGIVVIFCYTMIEKKKLSKMS